MKKLLLGVLSFSLGLAAAAQAPKADVLDIVFNDDGTVVDASPMAHPVHVMGAPDIKKSPRYGMNVLCYEEEMWGKESSNNVRVPYNDQLTEAIKDGMTMEVMVRPYFEKGTLDKTWVNLFGCYESGGFGIIIYGGKWDFESVIGGSYKDATFGPVVNGEWIHLVGVWNKETGMYKFFANGELVSTIEGATGELSFPVTQGKECFVGLGVDFAPNTPSVSSNTFQGDIAIARIYNDPLTDEQVKAIYQKVEAKKTDEPEHAEGLLPTLRTDEDGTVLVANSEELDNFACAVRRGHNELNAKLEADIDYSAAKKLICYDRGYKGTFDGQGHTLKVNINEEATSSAPFKSLVDATVRNLNITGNIVGTQKFTASLAANASGKTLIENVSSDVKITSTYEGDGTYGGLIGAANAGLTLNNCLFSGTISSETTTRCAGMVGWAGGKITIKNSLQVGDISSVATEGAVFARNPQNVSVINSYYTAMAGDSDNGATLVTDDELASGKVCWKLNGMTPANAAWRQNVEEDAMPVLNQPHGLVIVLDDVTYNVKDESTLTEVAAAYSEKILGNVEEYEAYKPLKDALTLHAQEVATCTTIDDFVAKCKEIDADVVLINKNKKAYDQLKAAGESTLAQIEGMMNQTALVLRAYLEDEIEPDEVYVHGSLNYIINNYSLSTEDIATEIQYMEDMLLKALASGTAPGTDVTMLVQNPDFSQKKTGWDWTKVANSFAYDAKKGYSGMHYYGSLEGSFSQTITGLTNGIYELDMNGSQLVGDDENCTYYTTFLFADDMEMPLMSVSEDIIPADDPIAEEINSLGDTRVMGDQLIPYSLKGATYAMCQGGYYLNRVFVNVTDGTLTIGGRLYGSGRSDDWPIFANTKLIYQGTFDEASESLDKGLEFAVARANTIIASEPDTWGENYVFYPNFDKTIRTELSKAVVDVESATTGEQKYALLKRFSDLFKQTYTCSKAYVQCARELMDIDARIQDFPDNVTELGKMVEDAWTGWNAGDYTAEEVLKVGPGILAEMDKLHVDVPAADLLDVAFNADGTVTDKSVAENTIETIGKPSVVESPTLGMNVYCGGKQEWGTKPENYSVVLVSDAMREGIESGVTMELLVRPYFADGAVPGKWCTVFGSENAGGMGLLVYNKKWCFEVHAGGGYKDAYATTAPASGEWTHIVGVWDGSEVKIYINGRMEGSAAAVGAYKWPVDVERQWFGIGCDLNTGDAAEAVFAGDIAVTRLYGTPLNGSQVSKLYKGAKALITDTPEHSEGETAIGGITEVKPATKGIYDITGRRVSRMDAKGLYIVNGKKIVVK